MRHIVKYAIACLVVVALAAFLPTLSHAKSKSSKGKGSSNKKTEWKSEKGKKKAESKTEEKEKPYGWSRGRKTGWRGGSYPPGWSKWNKEKREEWKEERVESVKDIDKYLVNYKFPEQQSAEIVGAFDKAIAGGMAIDDARKKVIGGLKDGDTRRKLMIDAAQESLNLLR